LIFLFISQVLFKKISFEYIKNKIKSISFPFRLLSALFFIYLLATIFSVDVRYSLWGDPFRAGGFITFSFYILFAIIIFLIIRQKDWQLILDFSIIIGVLVSIVAIFQQFGIFSKFFIPFTIRPGSTLGNPIFLAIYLLLLIFLTLTFGLLSKNRIKKFFYFFSLLLFFSVSIILTQTRAALAGLIIGSLWFFFGYPKKMRSLKISAAIILVFVILGMYATKTYLDSHLYVYKKMPPIVSSTVDRVLSAFEGTKIIESRVSAWKVSLNALKERPILGYGPENFHIGFDQYYDPLLPRIGTSSTEEGAEWFDRAHNLIFDISVTAGIPALIVYLSFFGALLWQLQSIKRKQPETAVICHGLQATFIAYLIANLFSFDTFDTYLLSFLLIGYSFYLISNYNLNFQI
jgi:O-antigen ligase